MAKNICVFSDGTGQGGSVDKFDNTNVWRLYKACEAADPSRTRQVCFYDPGLGADNHDWTRWTYNLVSKATGLGISKNIKECYAHVLEHYEQGDRIYLFGFSRGAYTVRSLGGVLKLCGVPTGWRAMGDAKAVRSARDKLIEEAVEKIYKHYGGDKEAVERRERGKEFRQQTNAFPAAPFFIGVWDTVRSLGFPGTSGLVGWRHAFHDATLDERVRFARHALALDENREAFQPELWDASDNDLRTGRIKQRWFAGVHSDVGGGYGDDCRLADITLSWMVEEATTAPDPGEELLVDTAVLPSVTDECALGLQHDERYPFSLFREGTRERHHERPWLGYADLADPSVRHRLAADQVPYLGGRSAAYRPVSLKRRLPGYTWPKSTGG